MKAPRPLALLAGCLVTWAVFIPNSALAQAKAQRHFLYVASPGIRDYAQFGGHGILVFDMDNGHKFVKRIPSPASMEKPANIKGICASAATRKLYISTPKKLYCLDLVTEKLVWEKGFPKEGCDRMSITPDGKLLYVPSFEGDTWNVVDGATGKVVETIETKSGAHNTICGLDGQRMYLAGLKSPHLSVADTKTHKVIKTVGPFSAPVRPFTVNADQTRCYVNVNNLLGFEVGDLTTGKVLAKVEVEGFKKGPVKRHGCPSHGVGLTPDEKELWLADGHNSHVHVFDMTVDPPKQTHSIKLREQPGWVTFSLSGRFAYPSTGEVIDTKTKKIMYTLTDEEGREVHSEKVVEIVMEDGTVVLVGDQFGLGRKRAKK
jgi:DNA-binding beta-propeller fold protein YncE